MKNWYIHKKSSFIIACALLINTLPLSAMANLKNKHSTEMDDLESQQSNEYPLLIELKKTVDNSDTNRTNELLKDLEKFPRKDANTIVSQFRDWLYDEKLDNTPYIKYAQDILPLDAIPSYIGPISSALIPLPLAKGSELGLGICIFFAAGSGLICLYTKNKILNHLNDALSCAINNTEVRNAVIYTEKIRNKLNLRSALVKKALKPIQKNDTHISSKELLEQLKESIENENLAQMNQLLDKATRLKAKPADKVTKDFRYWLYKQNVNNIDAMKSARRSFKSNAITTGILIPLGLATLLPFLASSKNSKNNLFQTLNANTTVIVIASIAAVVFLGFLISNIKSLVDTTKKLNESTNLAHKYYLISRALVAVEKIRNITKIKKLYEKNEKELLTLEKK